MHMIRIPRPRIVPFTLVLCVLASLVATGQKVEIKTNQDKTANFAAIKTYSWLPSPPLKTSIAPDAETNPNLTQEVLGPHIVAAVDRQLTSRGFRIAEGDVADVHVVYYAALGVGFNESFLGENYGYLTGWGSPIPSGLAPTTSFTVYQEGSIVIDVVERAANKAIWRSSAMTRINQENTLEKRIQRINEAVDRMFKNFPVQRKSGG
jgi:hypothetical protein